MRHSIFLMNPNSAEPRFPTEPPTSNTYVYDNENSLLIVSRLSVGRKVFAERQGFEPWIQSPVCRISSAVHSTTLASLLGLLCFLPVSTCKVTASFSFPQALGQERNSLWRANRNMAVPQTYGLQHGHIVSSGRADECP